MLQFQKVQLPKMKLSKIKVFKTFKLQKAQKAKMSKLKLQKSSMCTSDVAVNSQQCKDKLQAATATPLENLDNSGACVKKSKTHF